MKCTAQNGEKNKKINKIKSAESHDSDLRPRKRANSKFVVSGSIGALCSSRWVN